MLASRLILLALLLAPLPALAQDADPSNQLLEGYVACAMGEGLPDKTVTALGLYGWTHAEDTVNTVVNFRPGVGSDTLGVMSPTPGYCQIESTVLGTDRALELTGYLAFAGPSVTSTETNEDGCTTLTLSNEVVAVITSGGAAPVCTSDQNSAIRFYFAEEE
jgi:hypothetical protein